MAHFGLIRAGLYLALLVFTFILFVLCCVRINYTLHLAPEFYDPVVAELLFTTIVTLLWCCLMLCIFFIETLKLEFLRLYWHELIGLIILWFLWLGGAAAASSIFGDISTCQQFQACQILSALLAFAWLGWIMLTFLLIISIIVMIQSSQAGRKVLDEPLPDRNEGRGVMGTGMGAT
ncbi:hypothetical protein BT96DRAFT_104541 [Gymnopus androsaceus JB14]|uniref:MARVEL domain-containing protein n=1 Tax=Gymnopus androsaceus JB14 TaxID=1447944 RepID=A0A6A4IA34_9AGAR|nr:hypothetical protein BT96DRAFT_104541 [Gymnopus androsaceus JB14]